MCETHQRIHDYKECQCTYNWILKKCSRQGSKECRTSYHNPSGGGSKKKKRCEDCEKAKDIRRAAGPQTDDAGSQQSDTASIRSVPSSTKSSKSTSSKASTKSSESTKSTDSSGSRHFKPEPIGRARNRDVKSGEREGDSLRKQAVVNRASETKPAPQKEQQSRVKDKDHGRPAAGSRNLTQQGVTGRDDSSVKSEKSIKASKAPSKSDRGFFGYGTARPSKTSQQHRSSAKHEQKSSKAEGKQSGERNGRQDSAVDLDTENHEQYDRLQDSGPNSRSPSPSRSIHSMSPPLEEEDIRPGYDQSPDSDRWGQHPAKDSAPQRDEFAPTPATSRRTRTLSPGPSANSGGDTVIRSRSEDPGRGRQANTRDDLRKQAAKAQAFSKQAQPAFDTPSLSEEQDLPLPPRGKKSAGGSKQTGSFPGLGTAGSRDGFDQKNGDWQDDLRIPQSRPRTPDESQYLPAGALFTEEPFDMGNEMYKDNNSILDDKFCKGPKDGSGDEFEGSGKGRGSARGSDDESEHSSRSGDSESGSSDDSENDEDGRDSAEGSGDESKDNKGRRKSMERSGEELEEVPVPKKSKKDRRIPMERSGDELEEVPVPKKPKDGKKAR